MKTENMPSHAGQNLFLYQRKGDFPFEHNHNNFWEIIMPMKGSYINKVNDRALNMKRGNVFIMRPDDFHSTIKKEEDSSYIMCCVAGEYFENLLSSIEESMLPLLKSKGYIEYEMGDMEIDGIERYCISILKDDVNPIDSMCIPVLLKVLSELVRSMSYEMDKRDLPKCVMEFMDLVSDKENLSIPLQDLIERTHYSYSYLNSVFKHEMGETPSDYLKKKQLLFAKKMLISSDLKQIEIANKIGLSSQSRFCIFFKRMTGVTPSQYTRNAKTANISELPRE